ncbi:MAG TPA: DNA polymerase III subunit delta [Gammaproteobacteria bacterium]|jgi:DNA polymerase-3 subunit delta|nr:DNA polymerase III subunit delta [Gammaproteobacteria bacterium]
MQVKPEQLDAHLKKQLAPVYFISGDDPLRVMEAADAVRAAARAQGYDERDVLTVQTGFDWYSLQSEAGSLSLFSSQRVIDLRMPTGKPGREGAQALRDFAEQVPEDTLLLVTAGKLDPAARKSKWVQALDKAGVVLFIWPMDAREFNGWVAARMRRCGLEPTAEAVSMLADRVEGNLLACVQEIDKLYLLQGAGAVDADAITRLVADNARFDVFGLVDAALAGKAARSIRILHGLEAEGTAPQIVLWALAREIRQLTAMATQVAGGQAIPGVLSRYHVWANRKTAVGTALKRLKPAECNAMLRHCASIDRISKGRGAGNAWDELLQLTCRLAGQEVLSVA